MKIRITLKDPDTMHDAVDDAYKRAKCPPEVAGEGVTPKEWRGICEERATKAKGDISHRWMEYGEYLVVEYDTDDHSMVVIPN